MSRLHIASAKRFAHEHRHVPFVVALLGCGLGPAVVLAATAVPAVLPNGKPAEICATPLSNAKPVDGPMLHAEVRSFDFGVVQKGTVVRHGFVLSNYGTKPLEIGEVRPGAGCVIEEGSPRLIPPGGNGTLTVVFDTARLSGPVATTLLVVSNDAATPQGTLELKGTVREAISLSSPAAVFPAVTDPTTPITCVISIRHEVAGVLRLDRPAIDRADFDVALEEKIPGQEFELRVSTVPNLAPGTHRARITIKTSKADLPELSINAVVSVLPPFQVAPNALQLPAGKLAVPETRHVVVLNHRSGELVLSDLEVDAPGVGVAVQRAADGRQQVVTVTFPAGFDTHLARTMQLRGKTNRDGINTFAVPISTPGR